MAEALAVAAGKEIASKLIGMAVSAANEEVKLLWGARREIEKLSKTLKRIQDVLEDAEKKQLNDKKVREWLGDLKYIAYEAEDVLEEFVMEASRGPIGEEAPKDFVATLIHWTRLVCHCFLSDSNTGSNPILFLHNIAYVIKDIREKLDQINENRRHFEFKVSNGTSPPPFSGTNFTDQKREETSSVSENIFGRKEEIDNIIKELLGCRDKPESSSGSRGSEKVSLVPIVGMGGLGKTTLAQAVFNDERVAKDDQFPIRKWVFVGENFDAKRIMEEIIYDDKACNPGNLSLQNLTIKLDEKLKGCKFLIALDDLWCEDSKKWGQLWGPLTRRGYEGKVIITTRSQKVVSAVGNYSSDPLRPLSDDVCWSIFEEQAFKEGNSSTLPILRDIGKEIIRKLKGLPLAAKVVGRSLQGELDERRWRSVLDHEQWKLQDDENEIMPALKWSYYHLPPHLRQCFAYSSVFPKDHEFDKEALVQMWMALNYIKPLGDIPMEDIGCTYFDNLLDRSFFQYIDYRYVMHDLMHDLAESISSDECLRIEGGKSNKDPNPEKILHLSFKSSELTESQSQNLGRYKKSRSLMHSGVSTYVPFTVPCDLFLNLRSIRVLDFSYSGIKDITDSISELVHLRYLDLSFTLISHLPEELCSLCNLQTFKINSRSGDLRELPKGMNRLTNLRCLEADDVLISKIDGLGKLTSLQKIGEYSIFKERNRSNIVELENLNQLRGDLTIRNLYNVVSGEEAGQVKLQDKKFIDHLFLYWGYWREEAAEGIIIDEEVLEALQPPTHLKSMAIDRYWGIKYPTWMESQLPSSLVRVHLSNCTNLEALPPLGQLRCLHKLSLKYLPNVRELPELPPTLTELEIRSVGLRALPKAWGYNGLVESNNHTSLSTLTIESCEDLISLSESSIVNLPSLSYLEINWCSRLTTVGLVPHSLTALETLAIRGCEELVSLWDAEDPSRGLFSLSLKNFRVNDCPKLRFSPEEEGGQSSSSSLPLLDQVDTDNRSLVSWLLQHNLPSLKSIIISSDEQLQRLAASVPNLRDLTVGGCHDLRSLSVGLQSLSSLEKLVIDDCNQIHNLPENVLPISLRELQINYCRGLAAVPAGLPGLPSLVKMTIEDCDEIRSLPGDSLPVSLQELTIWRCSALQSVMLQSLSSLKKIKIYYCHEIQSLPEDSLPVSLQELEIWECSALQSLPAGLQSLSSLKKITIFSCPQIQSLPCLPVSLQEISIRDCPNIQSLPCLPVSLQEISIVNCPNIQSLPCLPVSLQEISIRDCAKIQSLPCLPVSLQEIRIVDCPKIQSLPCLPVSLQQISIIACPKTQSLPEKNLPTSLQRLIISDCPTLEEWCRVEDVRYEEDW